MLHSCGSSVERAVDIFESLSNEDLSLRPGAACYGAMMSICMRNNQYEDALTWYDRMRELGVKLQPEFTVDWLVASYNTRGVEDTRRILSSLVDDIEIGADRNLGFEVLRLFLPLQQVNIRLDDDLDNIRNQLRGCAELSPSEATRDWLIDIVRSLRLAEMEDNRTVTFSLQENELATRKSIAWKKAIQSILAFTGDNTE